MTEKKANVDLGLGLLEEDDEFDEFPAEGKVKVDCRFDNIESTLKNTAICRCTLALNVVLFGCPQIFSCLKFHDVCRRMTHTFRYAGHKLYARSAIVDRRQHMLLVS
uniref:Uncharacterized protein n=1 Tax=Eptatretus burgeri TaxID=7764 RepID=A0A8C4QQ58_EPTBU